MLCATVCDGTYTNVQALKELQGRVEEIPCVVGGREVFTGNIQKQVSVSIILACKVGFTYFGEGLCQGGKPGTGLEVVCYYYVCVCSAHKVVMQSMGMSAVWQHNIITCSIDVHNI